MDFEAVISQATRHPRRMLFVGRVFPGFRAPSGNPNPPPLPGNNRACFRADRSLLFFSQALLSVGCRVADSW